MLKSIEQLQMTITNHVLHDLNTVISTYIKFTVVRDVVRSRLDLGSTPCNGSALLSNQQIKKAYFPYCD